MNLRPWFPHFLLVVGISAGLSFAQSPNAIDRTSAIEDSLADQAMVPVGDPACPGEGSCCVGHGSPGCNNTNCCNLVCAIDYFCCFGWDSECASEADAFCGSVCAGSCPGEGDCCTTHAGGGCSGANCCDLVCLSMPACCETGWSAACAARAVQICDECDISPVFDCPQPGDCCTGRLFETGCDRPACCQTVCEMDPVCCDEKWDDICARKADQHCLNVCDCEIFGNFDADTAINLHDVAAFQNCFSGIGSAPVPSACACADYDGDGDSDLDDIAVFADLIAP